MDAQAHLNFLKNMRSQLDAQIAECEQAVKREFDAAQIPLPISAPLEVVFDGTHEVAYVKPAPIADDGWIEWNGGNASPTPEPDCEVDVKLRGGQSASGPARLFGWWWSGFSGDIIAYRIAGERT